MSTLAVTRAPVQTAQRPTRGRRDTRFPTSEAYTPNPRTGSSMAPEPAEGAEAGVPCWWSRAQWIEAVAADLDTATGRATLRQHHTSPAAVRAVAAADAHAADTATGRNVRTSHATVATRTGRSVDTVRRARRVLRDLGWSVELVRGRYMTLAERIRASLHKNSRQIRFASTRALTIPARARAVHPYPCGVKSFQKITSSVTPKPRKRAAGTPNPARKNKLTRPTAVVPVAVQKIAARLVQRMSWLDRGHEHLMGLSRGLMRCGVTAEWTTQDLMNALETDQRRHKLLPLPPDSQKNPRALFLHQLRRAITGIEPPARARAREHEARRRTHAAEAAHRAATATTKTSMPSWFRDEVAKHTAPAADENRHSGIPGNRDAGTPALRQTGTEYVRYAVTLAHRIAGSTLLRQD